MTRSPLWLPLLALLLACPPPADDDDSVDIPSLDDDDAADAPWPGCRSAPTAEDHDRSVLVAHPFAADQGEWSVLSLSVDGALTDTGQVLSAGRGPYGDVVFTPDGAIAFGVNDDGTLSVFEVGPTGEVALVDPAFGGFYASRVVVEPGGEVAWVVDGNWAENGGGLYRFSIDCDEASFGPPERVVEGKLPADLLFDPARDDRGLLVAREVPGTDPGDDVALLAWPDAAALMGGSEAFGDDEASVSDAVLTDDGRFALIGDFSGFSGIPNRVAIVEISDDDEVTPHAVLDDVYDPMALVASPLGDAVLVVSGYGDAVFVVTYDAGTGDFVFTGEPTYVGTSPQLPATASVVTRGELEGLILVAENQGVRGMRFTGEGTVQDLGLLFGGGGNSAISGAMGIQP
jgi:hypothetical protein